MEVERIIAVYNIQNEKHVTDLSVTESIFSKIKNEFVWRKNDPEFYDVYKINKKQYKLLVRILPGLETYSLDQYEMFLEANSK